MQEQPEESAVLDEKAKFEAAYAKEVATVTAGLRTFHSAFNNYMVDNDEVWSQIPLDGESFPDSL